MSANFFTISLLAVVAILSAIYIFHLRNQLLKSQFKISALGMKFEKTLITEQNKNQHRTKSSTEASAAKVRYLSGISHELRTPLNVIMGYAQLLDKQALDNDPNKDKYSTMRHNCEHLNYLIEGILEFSTIEAGKLKVQFETVDIHALINQMNTMFKHQAEQKGLMFKSNVDKKLPKTVKTDHKRLQQILMNLLNNAIKFTTSGQIEFTITYRNQVATFSIKDSGIGIEPTDLDRIFEPFERIEQHNKPIQGTGLGLPITRLLVDLLGGELKVNSQINHNFSQITSINKQQNTLNHILVVDDEKSHRELMVEILTPHQFQVSTAENAETVESLITQHAFALAIIDVSIPKVSGWQIAEWIKTHSPKTKIIMLSATPKDVKTNAKKYHDIYVTKPIKINQLLTDINLLLKLDWIKTHPTNIHSEAANDVELDKQNQNALMNMLEIGHINGIEKHLEKLVTQKVITLQQHKQLSKPIKEMNLAAFKRMIEHEQ